MGFSFDKSQLIEYIFDISSFSSSVRSGSIVAKVLARSVFQDQGGQLIIILCIQEAAISRALLACFCHIIYLKSSFDSTCLDIFSISIFSGFDIVFFLFKNHTNCHKFLTAYISIHSIILASVKLS